MKHTLLQQLVPPLVLRCLRKAKNKLGIKPSGLVEGRKEADWYDAVYSQSEEYRAHYTESRYYFVWSVLADRLVRAGARHVLDLGCGPGQVGSLLRDKGVSHYCGLDFSSKSIDLARQVCPDFEFRVADICGSDLLETLNYDTVITLEFLEHVEGDTEVIRRVRPGTHVLATVPNFPYISHVRHFRDPGEVSARYGSFFDRLSVDVFVEDRAGKKYFLLDGVRR